MNARWAWHRRDTLLIALGAVLMLQGTPLLTTRPGLAVAAVTPACPAAELRGLRAYHGARCLPLGLTLNVGMVEDDSNGHALIYATWDATATTVDLTTGKVIRTVPLGSKYDYVAYAVDSNTHHFFLSLQRGKYSRLGGNQVYMIDSRTGAVLRSLRGISAPSAIVVDQAHGHLLVADITKSSVLMYNTRTGGLLRALPSCQDTESLALSSTGHLFVRCINGLMLMQDAVSGKILDREVTPTSNMDNAARNDSGSDTSMFVNDGAGRVVVTDLPRATSRLYDTQTGHLVGTLARRGEVASDNSDYLLIPPMGSLASRILGTNIDVLDGQTGQVLRTIMMPVTNVFWIEVNPDTGNLLVLSDGEHDSNGFPLEPETPGTLTVLDGWGTTVLATLTLGLVPSFMLPDTTTNQLAIVSQGWAPIHGSLTLLPLDAL